MIFTSSLLFSLILCSFTLVLFTDQAKPPVIKDYVIFTEHPWSTEVGQNDQVTFTCQVNSTVKQCIWANENVYRVQPGISSGYERVGKFEDGVCGLRILHANLHRDDGEWKCEVKYESGNTTGSNISHSARLRVYVPPANIGITDKRYGIRGANTSRWEVLAGEEANGTVDCFARHSNPEADITWILEYDLIPGILEVSEENEEAKTFKTVNRPNFVFSGEHHGKVLKCRITHPVMSPVEILLHLVVTHPTTKVRITSGYNHSIHLNSIAVLTCVADGYPPPTFEWHRQEGKQETWEKIEVPGNSSVLEATKSGSYRCSAGNSLNSHTVPSEHAVIVLAEYPTTEVTILSEKKLEVAEGGSTSLVCQGNGYPLPSHMWMKQEKDLWLPVYKGFNLTINPVNITDSGLYKCIAFNMFNNKQIESKDIVELHVLNITTAPYTVASAGGVHLPYILWIYCLLFLWQLT